MVKFSIACYFIYMLFAFIEVVSICYMRLSQMNLIITCERKSLVTGTDKLRLYTSHVRRLKRPKLSSCICAVYRSKHFCITPNLGVIIAQRFDQDMLWPAGYMVLLYFRLDEPICKAVKTFHEYNVDDFQSCICFNLRMYYSQCSYRTRTTASYYNIKMIIRVCQHMYMDWASKHEVRLFIDSKMIHEQVRDSCHPDISTERVARLGLYDLYDNGIALLFASAMSKVRPYFTISRNYWQVMCC